MNGGPLKHRSIGDRVVSALAWGATGLVAAFFLILLWEILRHGLPLVSWEFLTEPPRNAGRAGGIAPMLLSTGLILVVCLTVALPIGLGTAILLAEFTAEPSLFGRLVRRSLDVLAGVPSIVFGLFGYAFFSITLAMGFSILSGGLTLACMVLPLLIRTTEEGFRAVPGDYRLSAAALGLSRTTTLLHLLLPAAAPGLAVGLILSIGRATAETAALIFTSGYVDRVPGSLWDSGRALSVHIFDLSMNVPGGNDAAYASALILMVFLLCINGGSIWLSDRWLHRRLALV